MRIDAYMTKQGLCGSRNKAQRLIDEGSVSINGKTIFKASLEVGENDVVRVEPSVVTEYVGRGALKLEHALKFFDIDVNGKCCADIGASTGGFTQCLLMHGASKVYAVDSGSNQLAQILRDDERVVSLENVNARYLAEEALGERVDVVVMDVSFISQTLIYPALCAITKPCCSVITLIKPQFETDGGKIGKNGVVRDEKTRKAAVEKVKRAALSSVFTVCGVTDSPITGGSGNKEFLMCLKRENERKAIE